MKIKSKKDLNGTSFGSSEYLITLDPNTKKVEVYIGDPDHMTYPDVSSSLREKTE